MIDRYDARTGRLLDEPEDDTDAVDYCPTCDEPLPAEWQENRRMIGWPDQFHDIEVQLWRVCGECGEREEGNGWYE